MSNNFIEIYTLYPPRDVLVNLNQVTSIVVLYLPEKEEEYWVNLVGDEGYMIDSDQYKAIKAKLIDNEEAE